MELKDFVSISLTQIVEGVIAAQQRVGPTGAFVNPQDKLSKMGDPKGARFVEIPGTGYYLHELQSIEFDVAVTVAESSENKGGIGVATILTIGAMQGSESSVQSVNRIRFKVPVAFPLHAKTTKAAPPASAT